MHGNDPRQQQAPYDPRLYPPPGYEVRRRRSWPRRHWFLTFITFPVIALVLIIIIAVSASSSGTGGAAGNGGGTVTYIVTGSRADVTYGPAGSGSQGSVPMHVTKKIPGKAPAYYSVSAQLNGPGRVSCKIEVNGKVISSGTASGSYNIADCEITQGISGWEDTNS